VGWVVGCLEGCIVGCPEGFVAAGATVGAVGDMETEGFAVVGLEVVVGAVVVAGANEGLGDTGLGLDEG